MATGSARTFNAQPAIRRWSPLIIGITGASSAGKTYSALRLAAGIQGVIGGEIYGADTESDRMLHYADYFKFNHIPFPPNHGPQDYLALVNYIAGKVGSGRGIAVLDSMSHEHEGEGGVLDQIEAYLQEKAGDDWSKRERLNFVAQIKPKRARAALNRRIVALGNIVWILCYRAQEKIKPKAKGQQEPKQQGKRDNEPENLGWQPITTSKLPYDMTVRFLLTPGCDGVPLLLPQNPAEKLLVKNPVQFREWFKDGEPLSEEMGERMARWSIGEKTETRSTTATSRNQQPAASSPIPTVAEYEACDGPSYKALEARRKEHWQSLSQAQRDQLETAKSKAFSRLSAQAQQAKQVAAPASQVNTPAEEGWTVESGCKALSECGDEAALQSLYSRIDEFFGGAPMEIEAHRDVCLEKLKEL